MKNKFFSIAKATAPLIYVVTALALSWIWDIDISLADKTKTSKTQTIIHFSILIIVAWVIAFIFWFVWIKG